MNLYLLRVVAVMALSSGPASAAAVPDRVADRFMPAAFEKQRIEGLLGERLRVNLEGRLLHVDEPRLLRGFEQPPGEQAWIGEHIGKYLDAACNTWRYTHDARLSTQMDRMARALMTTQKPGRVPRHLRRRETLDGVGRLGPQIRPDRPAELPPDHRRRRSAAGGATQSATCSRRRSVPARDSAT